ncbi:hypothetical protein ACET3Z_030147 [Daucus carota]
MAGSKGSKSGGSTSMGSKTGGSAATSTKTGGSQKGSGGSSGSKVQGSSNDTMKAPGQDGFISRSGFESDPKGYFKEVSKVLEHNSDQNILASMEQNNLALVRKPQMLDDDSEEEKPKDYTKSSSTENLSSEMVYTSKVSPDLNNLVLEEKPQILDDDSEQGGLTGSS